MLVDDIFLRKKWKKEKRHQSKNPSQQLWTRQEADRYIEEAAYKRRRGVCFAQIDLGETDREGVYAIRISMELGGISGKRPSYRSEKHRSAVFASMDSVYPLSLRVRRLIWRLSHKYMNWCCEMDCPLALTFIKMSGVFL